jgi:xanthine dehydrogenase accessory factor
MYKKNLVLVRGGGDIATGTIHRLVQAGFLVIVLEIPQPTVIRHSVALAQCVFNGEVAIEGVKAVLASSAEDALQKTTGEVVPVLVDPEGISRFVLQPFAVVDAILAKRNIGTNRDWAPVVIGLGPGFTAGQDVHAVVETNRGHHLGRVYYTGTAEPNTGVPGDIAGFTKERIIRAPANGSFTAVRVIGDKVTAGDLLGYVEDTSVYSPLTGMLRGLINKGVAVKTGMKIGDVDPRNIREHCWTISDKARAIGGGVLEALLHLRKVLGVRG